MMNNKDIKICLIGLFIMLGICLIGAMGEDKEVVEQPPVQQEQQIEDEFTGLGIEQQTQMAIDYLDDMAKESFGVGGYKIVSEEGKIILYGDIDTYEILSCSEADYSDLVDILLETSERVSSNIYDLGCTDVLVGVGVADVSEDTVFLLAEDGRLLFDIFNQ
jgi:hypothetical protein